MNRRESPWKFPACTAIALTLLSMLSFVVPVDWLRALWPPLVQSEEAARPAGLVIHLLPPRSLEVEVEVLPEARPMSEEHLRQTPLWWQEAWRQHLLGAAVVVVDRGVATDSTLETIRLLDLDFPVQVQSLLATADSSLTRRLAVLNLLTPDSWDLLRPYLQAVATARIHQGIAAQAAALFDESIMMDIQVTDTPADRRPESRRDR